MQILVRNQASIPNKHIRYAKWRLRKIKEKFGHLQHTEIYFTSEGSRSQQYKTTLVIGVPGNNLILKHKSNDLNALVAEALDKLMTSLRKRKCKINSKYPNHLVYS